MKKGQINTGRPKAIKPVPLHYTTNFYPLYSSGNDQVDPVSSIRPIAFQRILPNYEISTSDTRDSGLGPALDVLSEARQLVKNRPKRAFLKKSVNTTETPHPFRGRLIEIQA